MIISCIRAPSVLRGYSSYRQRREALLFCRVAAWFNKCSLAIYFIRSCVTTKTNASCRRYDHAGFSILRIFIIVLTLLVSTNSLADRSSFFGSKKLTADDFVKSKCVNSITYYSELLSSKEVCKYGSNSCSNIDSSAKVKMYCLHENLSECFENKAWLTEHQLMGLPESIEIGLVSRSMSYKSGVRSDQVCAYYDPK